MAKTKKLNKKMIIEQIEEENYQIKKGLEEIEELSPPYEINLIEKNFTEIIEKYIRTINIATINPAIFINSTDVEEFEEETRKLQEYSEELKNNLKKIENGDANTVSQVTKKLQYLYLLETILEKRKIEIEIEGEKGETEIKLIPLVSVEMNYFEKIIQEMMSTTSSQEDSNVPGKNLKTINVEEIISNIKKENERDVEIKKKPSEINNKKIIYVQKEIKFLLEKSQNTSFYNFLNKFIDSGNEEESSYFRIQSNDKLEMVDRVFKKTFQTIETSSKNEKPDIFTKIKKIELKNSQNSEDFFLNSNRVKQLVYENDEFKNIQKDFKLYTFLEKYKNSSDKNEKEKYLKKIEKLLDDNKNATEIVEKYLDGNIEGFFTSEYFKEVFKKEQEEKKRSDIITIMYGELQNLQLTNKTELENLERYGIKLDPSSGVKNISSNKLTELNNLKNDLFKHKSKFLIEKMSQIIGNGESIGKYIEFINSPKGFLQIQKEYTETLKQLLSENSSKDEQIEEKLDFFKLEQEEVQSFLSNQQILIKKEMKDNPETKNLIQQYERKRRLEEGKTTEEIKKVIRYTSSLMKEGLHSEEQIKLKTEEYVSKNCKLINEKDMNKMVIKHMQENFGIANEMITGNYSTNVLYLKNNKSLINARKFSRDIQLMNLQQYGADNTPASMITEMLLNVDPLVTEILEKETGEFYKKIELTTELEPLKRSINNDDLEILRIYHEKVAESIEKYGLREGDLFLPEKVKKDIMKEVLKATKKIKSEDEYNENNPVISIYNKYIDSTNTAIKEKSMILLNSFREFTEKNEKNNNVDKIRNLSKEDINGFIKKIAENEELRFLFKENTVDVFKQVIEENKNSERTNEEMVEMIIYKLTSVEKDFNFNHDINQIPEIMKDGLVDLVKERIKKPSTFEEFLKSSAPDVLLSEFNEKDLEIKSAFVSNQEIIYDIARSAVPFPNPLNIRFEDKVKEIKNRIEDLHFSNGNAPDAKDISQTLINIRREENDKKLNGFVDDFVKKRTKLLLEKLQKEKDMLQQKSDQMFKEMIENPLNFLNPFSLIKMILNELNRAFAQITFELGKMFVSNEKIARNHFKSQTNLNKDSVGIKSKIVINEQQSPDEKNVEKSRGLSKTETASEIQARNLSPVFKSKGGNKFLNGFLTSVLNGEDKFGKKIDEDLVGEENQRKEFAQFINLLLESKDQNSNTSYANIVNVEHQLINQKQKLKISETEITNFIGQSVKILEAEQIKSEKGETKEIILHLENGYEIKLSNQEQIKQYLDKKEIEFETRRTIQNVIETNIENQEEVLIKSSWPFFEDKIMKKNDFADKSKESNLIPNSQNYRVVNLNEEQTNFIIDFYSKIDSIRRLDNSPQKVTHLQAQEELEKMQKKARELNLNISDDINKEFLLKKLFDQGIESFLIQNKDHGTFNSILKRIEGLKDILTTYSNISYSSRELLEKPKQVNNPTQSPMK